MTFLVPSPFFHHHDVPCFSLPSGEAVSGLRRRPSPRPDLSPALVAGRQPVKKPSKCSFHLSSSYPNKVAEGEGGVRDPMSLSPAPI